MTCLDWKSDSAATVIHPLQKGTGESPERHRRGKTLAKAWIEFSIQAFLLTKKQTSNAQRPTSNISVRTVIPSEVKESRGVTLR
jgi:hypothetical protein